MISNSIRAPAIHHYVFDVAVILGDHRFDGAFKQVRTIIIGSDELEDGLVPTVEIFIQQPAGDPQMTQTK